MSNAPTPEIKCGKCCEHFATPAALDAHWKYGRNSNSLYRVCTTPNCSTWNLEKDRAGLWRLRLSAYRPDTNNWYREQKVEYTDWSWKPWRPFTPWDSCEVFA
jgi:hypothetical protein